MIRSLFVVTDPIRAAVLREVLDVGESIRVDESDRARWLLGLTEPSLLVVDAAVPWGVDVIDAVVEDVQTAVLVVAENSAMERVPVLLRAGADAILALPAGRPAAAAAVEAAFVSRSRRRASRAQIDSTKWQLDTVTADLRSDLERERDRARGLATTLSRLERSYLETVRSLAIAVDAMDPASNRAVERVAQLAESLAALVSPTAAAEPYLGIGFLLHDLGESALPMRVLGKQGPLDEAERAVMRTHAVIGADLVETIDLLRPCAPIIRHHHERWDGKGYPHGLAGEDIPVAARVFAVADAADAMLHDRPYRGALSVDAACDELRRCAGTQFDPTVVDAFMTVVGAGVHPFA